MAYNVPIIKTVKKQDQHSLKTVEHHLIVKKEHNLVSLKM
jgi:hypothetical protein